MKNLNNIFNYDWRIFNKNSKPISNSGYGEGEDNINEGYLMQNRRSTDASSIINAFHKSISIDKVASAVKNQDDMAKSVHSNEVSNNSMNSFNVFHGSPKRNSKISYNPQAFNNQNSMQHFISSANRHNPPNIGHGVSLFCPPNNNNNLRRYSLDITNKFINPNDTHVNQSTNNNKINNSTTYHPTMAGAQLPVQGVPNMSHMTFINNYALQITKNFHIDDKYLLDNVLILLKDQNGCRIAQKKLEERATDFEFVQNFYNKIESNLIDIINNQFGNYVVQKYFEIIHQDNSSVSRIFEKIRFNIFEISIHQYGTRFFQKALELLISNYNESETTNSVLKELIEKHMMDLIVDTNGNHVFQKILLLYPKNKNQFLYDKVTNNAIAIAKVKQGGCTIQRAFDYSNTSQRVKLV